MKEMGKAVIALEANGGNYEGDGCIAPVTPTIYNVTRFICHKFLGASLGYVACDPNGARCSTTYQVQCVNGSLVYTLVSGPTATGDCDLDPAPDGPCNTKILCQ